MTKSINAFDFLNAINSSKVNLLDDPDIDSNSYVPFLVNRSLSYFPDTILYANEINMYADLDKDMQFHFYLNSIRPRKRFSKWTKPIENEDLKLICDVYGYNSQLASQVLKFLTPEDLDMLRKQKEVGGIQSDSRVSR